MTNRWPLPTLAFAASLLPLPFHSADAQLPLGQLDPTRNAPVTEQQHTPLPEEYIWTAGDANDSHVIPHYFRTRFQVAQKPAAATLYVAGGRAANVWINGEPVAHFTSDIDAPINFHVFHIDVSQALHPGQNTLAIETFRSRGAIAGAGPQATRQLSLGNVLVAKIVPAAYGAEAPALVLTDTHWKASASHTDNWEKPAFNDTAWQNATSLGPIESNVDFFQWSVDAGMYEWPGYMGMSPTLRALELKPAAISHLYEGQSTFANTSSLTKPGAPFTITHFAPAPDLESPALLADFGREIAGRILIHNASPCEVTLSVAYGEDDLEALATGLTPQQRGGNYLGTNLLHVPPNGIARGPKSGFRYARIRILQGCDTITLPAIDAEAIYYPVTYKGSFESSDETLNRIWETGAYTAHLCMQDGIWDAPKRDRGRWAGDLDIEGKTILTAFGDTWLLEDTLDRLAATTPDGAFVNGIPAYSAQWIAGLYGLYLHSGDKALLTRQHDHLTHILATMNTAVDNTGNLKPSLKGWGFVDWSPGLYANTHATELGTALEFARAYTMAAAMLHDLNDSAAPQAATLAQKLVAATATQGYGNTWQINTLAILTTPDRATASTIAAKALSNLHQDQPTDQSITPYFNAYVLDALARTNRHTQALDWLRTYWGGMLAEGATSFWEAYDLRWPKTNPHLSLQADGTSGDFVSLAHGWSSGPTAWLSEQVLGIEPTSPGYATVAIHPHLANLAWAKGAVPTPHGLIAVSIDSNTLHITLPTGITTATVTLDHAITQPTLNGVPIQPDTNGAITLHGAGDYSLRWP